MSDVVKQLMPPATTVFCWMEPKQFSYVAPKTVLQLKAGPCVWRRTAQVISADANYAAVKSYLALYLTAGIKMTNQILSETQSRMSRKRQVTENRSFLFSQLHIPTFLRRGKTGEKGWVEKLAHRELKHQEL